MKIDCCLCFQKKFSELKLIADASKARSVEDLQQHVVFGQQCKLCHPYVRRMLRTGEVVFDTIITDDGAVKSPR